MGGGDEGGGGGGRGEGEAEGKGEREGEEEGKGEGEGGGGVGRGGERWSGGGRERVYMQASYTAKQCQCTGILPDT